MHLKQLSLVNFKNYEESELFLSKQANCFTGNNGEGKTNVLDAIHYLSFCKSFFNPIDSHNIKHEAPFFLIQGHYELNNVEEEIYCGLKKNQKKVFKRNKKEYNRLADHIGLFPLVMISPSDSDLITEGSESRRKFIDSVISQFDKKYLEALISYNKIISQRNALLKHFGKTGSFDAESLEIWDMQLIVQGHKIHAVRKDFLEGFTPIFQHYYEQISGNKEQVNITYSSHLNEAGFEHVLANALQKDRFVEYTSAGTHKDNLIFTINGYPVKKYASQGQQKSFLIALKLAQFDVIKKQKEIAPILLLDDIYDKLDDLRVQQLMQLVCSENFGQLFITDTHPTRLSDIFKRSSVDYKAFTIKSGSAQATIQNES